MLTLPKSITYTAFLHLRFSHPTLGPLLRFFRGTSRLPFLEDTASSTNGSLLVSSPGSAPQKHTRPSSPFTCSTMCHRSLFVSRFRARVCFSLSRLSAEEEHTLVRPLSLVISFSPRRCFAILWKGRNSHIFSLHFYLRDADMLSLHHPSYDRGARKSSIRATAKMFQANAQSPDARPYLHDCGSTWWISVYFCDLISTADCRKCL